ncbi:MAG TPA: sigma-70 family RNA polymerase sigma factor, partial [Gaiellaceae bacterium]|nr:sigma-70 family RNA polymerase sigma factor [Gaiellaceae bacterium]
ELYRAHAPVVYRYVYAVLGNPADAEDVTQTTFVNALRALERGEHPRMPENWLITIAHNIVRQRWRQEQSRPREVELDRDVATLEADDDGPSIDDLVRALQRIPESQREALVLREMEGRSYKEIASILSVSLTALETLIFRARRSLAEELENLVTCDRAELALSQQEDRRLGRKERKRLVAHLEECTSCARVAATSMKRRSAFKVLALLPLPVSLTLFKGAPSASAAIGLPTIGAGAAAGGGAAAVGTGLAAKLAIGAAAVAVASGAGYEGVKAVREPATPVRPAKAVPAAVVPAGALSGGLPGNNRSVVESAPGENANPVTAKPAAKVKPAVRGKSATAPGQLKKPAKLPKLKAPPTQRGNGPAVVRPRGKSALAPGKLRPLLPPKAKVKKPR